MTDTEVPVTEPVESNSILAPKPKRKLTEAQLANLAKRDLCKGTTREENG